jgi:4-hydroxybenzoate polyprenyltransferase
MHPTKKNRPIASSQIKVKEALICAAMLLIVSLMIAIIRLNQEITLIIIIYIAINILYSTVLKNIPIIDVFTISLGFMLRMFVGAALTIEEPSHWIILMTFFLALFISFCKRRTELIIMKSQSKIHRRLTLKFYSPQLIDQINASLVSIIILYYTFYTFNYTDERLGVFIPYTVPIVTFGCLRYLYLIQIKNHGENPVKLLLNDFGLLLTVIIWFITIIVILYY